MGHKIDPLLLQLLRRSAGVGIACLFPVRDQDNRRLLFGILELIRCLFQRSADWRLAFGFDRYNRIDDLFLIDLADRDDIFDVVTISLSTMPIDCQPQLYIRVPLFDDIFQRVSGDHDLWHSIDLPPHTPRCVENDHCLRLIRCSCTTKECRKEQHDTQYYFFHHYPPMLLIEF